MVLSLGLAPYHPASAAVSAFAVNSVLDQLDDDAGDGVCHTAAGTCTLRAAVMQANAISGLGVTINLPAGTYTLTRPITGANGPDSGDLNLTAPTSGNPVITIAGAGAASTIIDGNGLDGVFSVAIGRTASLTGVTVRNGYSTGNGGGILNAGILTISLSTISGNQVGYDGGGVANTSQLTISHSTIADNQAGDYGGGVTSVGNQTKLTISHSTIADNQAGEDGGGVFSLGSSLYMINSTVSRNDADGSGGGIYFYGTALVFNSTIVFNQADADANLDGGSGGGVYVYGGSFFYLSNTLVAGNHVSGAPVYRDCAGTVISGGRNLFWDVTGCTVSIDSGSWTYLNSLAGLGPLRNNGGPTWTHALLPGSNAIDGGDPTDGCRDHNGALLATDQRGAARVVGVRCDIGAFEYRPPVYLPAILR